MGFSAFAGLMGGMGKSAEQVLDRNLTRLDAAGVAQEKEAAQMRLDDRVNQYKQEAVQLGYKRDDFTHDRGLMDVKNQTADALKAKLAEETRTQDPAYIAKVIAGKNQEHSGLTTGQESTAKNKSEINAHDAEAEYDRAHAKKALAEIGNGGAKPLTEPELAARVETGDKSLRILYNIGTDPVTGQFTGKAEDIDGYIKAKPHLERAVRNQESLPAAFVDQISDHRKAGTSLAKTKEESDTKTGVANINQGKSWYQSNISPEEFKKLPKEEQYKAINQSKAPAPSDPKAATGAPVARTPFKEQALESGSGLPSAGATTTPKTENPLVSQIPDGKGAKVTKESHPEGWEGDYTKPDGTTIRVRATKTGFVPIEPAKQKGLMERAESTPVAPLSTPKAPNASAQTQVPNTPSEATATQKLIDTFEALPGNATMEERFVVLKEGAKNPEFRKEYPISIKGYEAYIKKHPDQISDSAKPKDSGKSKAEIGSAIRALDAGSVTVADRIAGMKELLKTPEFIQYYPDLAKTYKKAIVNAGQ